MFFTFSCIWSLYWINNRGCFYNKYICNRYFFWLYYIIFILYLVPCIKLCLTLKIVLDAIPFLPNLSKDAWCVVIKWIWSLLLIILLSVLTCFDEKKMHLQVFHLYSHLTIVPMNILPIIIFWFVWFANLRFFKVLGVKIRLFTHIFSLHCLSNLQYIKTILCVHLVWIHYGYVSNKN